MTALTWNRGDQLLVAVEALAGSDEGTVTRCRHRRAGGSVDLWVERAEVRDVLALPIKVGDEVALPNGTLATVLAVDGEEAWCRFLGLDSGSIVKELRLLRRM